MSARKCEVGVHAQHNATVRPVALEPFRLGLDGGLVLCFLFTVGLCGLGLRLGVARPFVALARGLSVPEQVAEPQID